MRRDKQLQKKINSIKSQFHYGAQVISIIIIKHLVVMKVCKN